MSSGIRPQADLAEALKANGATVESAALDGKRGHLDGALSIKQPERAISAFLAK